MAVMYCLELGGPLAGLRCRKFSLHRPKKICKSWSNLSETAEARPIRIAIGMNTLRKVAFYQLLKTAYSSTDPAPQLCLSTIYNCL
jgi:hypothetical protein